jgi:hypothetical protein
MSQSSTAGCNNSTWYWRPTSIRLLSPVCSRLVPSILFCKLNVQKWYWSRISTPATESRQNHREAIEASWMESELLINTISLGQILETIVEESA